MSNVLLVMESNVMVADSAEDFNVVRCVEDSMEA